MSPRTPPDLRSPSRSALLVAAAYAVVGWLALAFTGLLVSRVHPDPLAQLEATVLAGLVFVSVTALALFVALRFELRRRQAFLEPIHEQNRRILHHFEQTPLAFVELDREFRVRHWSTSAQRLFGWTASEAVGRRWDEWEMVDPDDRQSLTTLLQSIPHSPPGGTLHMLRHLKKDGGELWCEWHTSWSRDPSGTLRIVSTAQDITRDRESMAEVQRINMDLELQVARRTRELTRANRDLRAFTQSVSKDLRAPVRSVISFAENLRDHFGDELPPEARRNLVYILAAGRQMDHLIEDLLDYAGLGSGELSRTPVDVHDLTLGVVAELEGDFPEAPAAVTPPRSAITVAGDPELLRRVMRNLLENALKYREASRPARIEVSTERTDREVVVKVRDNGPGIPEGQRDAVFRLFHRLHDLESHPGTGMGLAIVRKAMGLMGGTATVEDHSGPGVTFVLRFPTQDALARQDGPAPEFGFAERSPQPEAPPNISSASAP